jgi:hypothetical protein
MKISISLRTLAKQKQPSARGLDGHSPIWSRRIMFKVATLSAIVLIALESVIGAKGCDPTCYSRAGLWTDKCHDDDDCNDCHPCNYMIPDKSTDVRSPCPAFNTLANHGVISRDGKCINGTDAVEKFQTYFGCQMETCMLVLTQVATFNPIQNLTCFDLDVLFGSIKQTSWINDDSTKEFSPGKFEQLAAKADKYGKINNWILMEHQTKVIIQSRCKGRWNNSKYESPFGPRLGFPGDNPFMFNFATSEDFKVKYMGVNNTNAPFSGIPYMHLDIKWLRSIFQHNRFPNDYVPRNCSTNKDDCFGQAFGSVLKPYFNIWTETQKGYYNAMHPEPEFSLISEHIVRELNFAAYKNLTVNDCIPYYVENSVPKTRKPTSSKTGKPHITINKVFD